MLRVSSSTAEKCNVDQRFKAGSIERLEQPGMIGILQDRRKRLFDFVVAVFLLIFLAPAFVIISAMIRLTSKGPVLFRQKRYGRFKRPFHILKFRTMTVMEEGEDFKQATRNDVRITRLGAILRRTSLDELPQLWNVACGDMSLVGPRPHAISMDDEYAGLIPGYDRRFLMRPGITGLAQCKGYRGGTDHINQMIGRLSRDIYYVRNRTMKMDFSILAATILALLKHDAY